MGSRAWTQAGGVAVGVGVAVGATVAAAGGGEALGEAVGRGVGQPVGRVGVGVGLPAAAWAVLAMASGMSPRPAASWRNNLRRVDVECRWDSEEVWGTTAHAG